MHGLDTKTSGIPWATPYSHRPVQKLLALIATPNSGTPAFAFSNIHEVGMVCLGTTERRNRYRYPQILSVSDMPACLVHSHGRETTIRPFATEKLSDK